MQLLTHSPFLGVSTRVVLQHQPLPKELKLLYTLPISLIWSTTGLAFSVTPTPKAWVLTWSLSCCFLPGTPSGAILTGCCVERIFFLYLMLLGWPKGHCMNYLPFNLFRGLLLLWAPFEIVLSGHLVWEGLQSDWFGICILQKSTVQKKACVSFLLVGGDRAVVLIHRDLTTSILPFYS